ncbi:uncharacterized protein DNG_03528 [Cephalotrichum gorgonifer]|uniref:Zn(2)-C6 fungal-type domain-containing protein n=1 Tax=Cephalotrichum gorgonifer TaxID=2041049 RepID=A0AAE8SUD0_9PEZI|nr:uncharacterized protein DNG_03528 [Cephalotrichum gorgonifer]
MADTFNPVSHADSRPQKMSITCERCKRLKSRCDRRAPSCRRCEVAGAPCEYLGRRRPGFPAGCRQVLEEKISLLQAEVDVLRGKQQGNCSSGAVLTPSSPSISEPDGHNGTCRPLEGRPSPLDQTKDGGEGVVAPRAAIEQPPLSTLLRTNRIKERKPPDDLVASLISLFFLHIHPWIPFLDAQQVLGEMGRLDEPPLLCHALFGISLPFSLDSRLTQSLCDSFWKYTKRRILFEVLEEPSYASLEALAVLTLDLSGMTNGPQVWGALAIAVRLAVQLKTLDGRVLRTSPTEEGSEGEAEREGPGGSPTLHAAQLRRRRLFWAIYTLDCYVSITTSHPSELGEHHIAHFLPSRDATWPANGGDAGAARSIAVFGYHLKLMDISRALHTTYFEYAALSGEDQSQVARWLQRVADCSSALTDWFREIPQGMQYVYDDRPDGRRVGESRRCAPPSVAMAHAYYHSLVIYLHGLVAFPSLAGIGSHSHPEAYRSASREKCASSVESLVSIASSVTKNSVAKLGWPFAWSLWVAARHILIARHNGFAFPAEKFDALLRCLEWSARYWQIGGKYWRLLRQADDEQNSGSSVGGDAGVLCFLLDQRVATSDLEDRFRIDSFFKEAVGTSEPMSVSGVDSRLSSSLRVNLETVETGDLDGLLAPDLFGPSGDSWFSGPLSASSAYQQTYPVYYWDGRS